MNRVKNVVILVETIAIVILLIPFFWSSGFSTKPQNTDNNKDGRNAIGDEAEFPPLNLSPDLFEPSVEGLGAGSYSVIPGKQAYQSYPSTIISLNESSYSATPTALPAVKTDDQIYAKEPEDDFMADAKRSSIKKFGDIARRYAGGPSEGWYLDSIEEGDIDRDGSKEKILMLIEIGANIIGQRSVIIKDDKEIFSTTGSTFSEIIPAQTGNGFFLKWDDNFKKRDGFVATRFIYENSVFIPVYEQKIRYIRIMTK